MNDAERIEAAIDRPHEQLLLLADIHDEAGKNVLAEGYRLLHQHKKWPKRTAACWSWSEAIGWTEKGYPARLPVGVPIPRREFASASLALRAAALALAWWKRGTKARVADANGEPPYRVMCGDRLLGTVEPATVGMQAGWRGIAELPDPRTGSRPANLLEHASEAQAWVVRTVLAARPLPESSR